MDPENKKKGFIPQDEEYYQNEEQPVRRDIEPLERLEPITDPDAGPTQPAEKGLAPVATETPVELNAEQQLARDYAQQIQAENAVADNQINSVADLVSAAEKERSSRLANDETARRRENAYRYIAGVGDAISGVANLVGTAHGAAHQQQSYNAPGLMSKIESSRAQRTKKMEDLNKKIDELRQRETELKSAKSLREAQLKATHAKEQRALRIQQEATAREESWKEKEHELKQQDAETRRLNAMASGVRAEAYAKKPATTAKPSEEYSFDLVGGETISIPGHKWNESTLTSIYSLVPDDIKTKKPKMVRNIAGQNEIAKDEKGNIIYITPSKQEMLNDVVKAAASNKDVADALRRKAKGSGANDSKWK